LLELAGPCFVGPNEGLVATPLLLWLLLLLAGGLDGPNDGLEEGFAELVERRRDESFEAEPSFSLSPPLLLLL
jgi:hypothetical protein